MYQPAGLFKLTGLAVVTFYLLFSPIQAIDVTYCDKKGDYIVKVHGVEIIPDPVVTGQPATFKISAFSGNSPIQFYLLVYLRLCVDAYLEYSVFLSELSFSPQYSFVNILSPS
ncbi:hypothetical protein Pint_31667 [Pistacia integerrima]|uniref:Uncharacterized protein n=1 Tax=Pistacia integerrima TaxID=434235 RepID=A0ACC0XPM0_9ROSI|nr:hypothetical protein Pint_31667 [Pistacia integerrima]